MEITPFLVNQIAATIQLTNVWFHFFYVIFIGMIRTGTHIEYICYYESCILRKQIIQTIAFNLVNTYRLYNTLYRYWRRKRFHILHTDIRHHSCLCLLSTFFAVSASVAAVTFVLAKSTQWIFFSIDTVVVVPCAYFTVLSLSRSYSQIN